MKSNKWLKRQSKDPYVKNAQKSGFLSRASYKLIEIEEKYKILSKSNNILELGSSPGGWTQVIYKFNQNAKVDAFDIIEMQFKNQNINFYKTNFTKFDFYILNKKYDLILSDLSPNSTGHKNTDHLKIFSLINEIYNKLNIIADEKSNFVFKILKGQEEKEFITKLKTRYKKVDYFKPKSSRKDSSEIYIIAKDFKKN